MTQGTEWVCVEGFDHGREDHRMEAQVRAGDAEGTAVAPGVPTERTAEAACHTEEAQQSTVNAATGNNSEVDEAVTVEAKEAMSEAAGSCGSLSPCSHGSMRAGFFWKAFFVGVGLGLVAGRGAAAMALVVKRSGEVVEGGVCEKEELSGLRSDLTAMRKELDEAKKATPNPLESTLAVTRIELDKVRETSQATQEKLDTTRRKLDEATKETQREKKTQSPLQSVLAAMAEAVHAARGG